MKENSKHKNYDPNKVIRDLERKGCVVTTDQPITRQEMEVIHTPAGPAKAPKTRIIQPSMTINTAHGREIGNKTLGKVDYMVKHHGFNVKKTRNISAIILLLLLFTFNACKSVNKANYGNKAGQGKYWKQGAKVNHHRL